MARFEAVLKTELNPRTPIPDIMAVIEIMMQNNPGHEQAILKGVAEAIDVISDRMTKKGETPNGK